MFCCGTEAFILTIGSVRSNTHVSYVATVIVTVIYIVYWKWIIHKAERVQFLPRWFYISLSSVFYYGLLAGWIVVPVVDLFIIGSRTKWSRRELSFNAWVLWYWVQVLTIVSNSPGWCLFHIRSRGAGRWDNSSRNSSTVRCYPHNSIVGQWWKIANTVSHMKVLLAMGRDRLCYRYVGNL